MIFTDASQTAFPDPWDLPTLPTPPVTADALADAEPERHATTTATPTQPTTHHCTWREMLADIQHGLQWGLDH